MCADIALELLVVDDESALRESIVRYLRRPGVSASGFVLTSSSTV